MADSERSMISIQAVVMIYDNNTKTWATAGAAEGNSKVQIYHHPVNNTFRVVARKLQDHEVVINAAILKNLKYNRATETFHQWRDRSSVYGLNFLSPVDANDFGQAFENVLSSLNGPAQQMPPPPPPAQPSKPPQPPQPPPMKANNYDQDDSDINDNRSSGQYGIANRGAPAPASTPMMRPPGPPRPPLGPPSSAPAPPPAPPFAPPAPPGPPGPPPMPPAAAPPPAVGAPPPPPPGGGPPPPPPPPPPPGPPPMNPPGGGGNEGGGGGGLAAALAGAKLKKTQQKEESSHPVSSGPSSAAPRATPAAAPVSSGGGGGDMMSEMQKKLQARKAKTENPAPVADAADAPTPASSTASLPMVNLSKQRPSPFSSGDPPKKPPAPILTDSSLNTPRDVSTPMSALPNSDLEAMKQQIMSEMRLELNKIKDEILAAIRTELNRR